MAGGRIPDSFIHDLLSRTDIVEVVGSRVELKRAGREYKGLSPFTNEKSPSFFVNPAKQMFFDFSSGKNGTAITFLMENDRLSFVEAVEELAKRAGVEVPREGGNEVSATGARWPARCAGGRRKASTAASSETHQPAIDYLKKRGLDGETAKLFNVGFAPESWDALTRLFPEADGQRQPRARRRPADRTRGRRWPRRWRLRPLSQPGDVPDPRHPRPHHRFRRPHAWPTIRPST